MCGRYDVLAAYKVFSTNGCGRYHSGNLLERLNTLFDNQSILNTLENLDIDKMIDELQDVKYKNEFHNTKMLYCTFSNFKI